MEQTTDLNKTSMQAVKLTQSDFNAAFIRSNFLQASWNFERMQALGYCFQMVPIIKRLYPDQNSPERKAAIKRHLEFYNTHPYMTAPILGVNLAMEEERANGADIDDAAINGMKVGLMGPLAGVGDPIFWATVRPVLGALGASFALSGSIVGPLLFFIGFNLIRLAMRFYTMKIGYREGLNIVGNMGGGLLQKLTEGASIMGLFIMGVLVNQWTHINIPLKIGQDTEIQQLVDGVMTTQVNVAPTVQQILDQLMPGLAALGCTWACMALLKRGINALWLILGIFVIGLIGYKYGILGL
ncbi:PTS mannose transporter subunit IID [Suttonella ornithocola]|uniref:PTS system mannose-specific EIID component n=1 Tax=Suttonella ornithocola TaxID=279832 RepID=A0A380MTT3_9GAMM|nr:PTS mannose transporter subunit IID [Suttonella ornithocola]SUO95604.1 PTS system mannose-specific EIID component [Suttonella ornithocola]